MPEPGDGVVTLPPPGTGVTAATAERGQQLTLVGYDPQPVAPWLELTRVNEHVFVVSEQTPDTPPTLHVGRVQQNTSLPAVWHPVAPLDVVVDTPSWQSAIRWHEPELPLPSLHGKPMPEPGDGVVTLPPPGTGVTAATAERGQQLTLVGYDPQPVAPWLELTRVKEHVFVVSEQTPVTPPTLHVGRVQQKTVDPAVWHPVAPFAVVVDTPSWQEAIVWHEPELPLPSLHGKPMPEPGDGVGAAPMGTGVGATPTGVGAAGVGPLRQQFTALG
jgi:enamine deaminase RidA (YjgF/YER057c/UK114 family)